MLLPPPGAVGSLFQRPASQGAGRAEGRVMSQMGLLCGGAERQTRLRAPSTGGERDLGGLEGWKRLQGGGESEPGGNNGCLGGGASLSLRSDTSSLLWGGTDSGLGSNPHPSGMELWHVVLGIKSSWLPS